MHTGHCGKTMAIVDRFYSDASLSGRRWLIIADDDTILRYIYHSCSQPQHGQYCVLLFLTTVSLDCADFWLVTMPLFLFYWERFMVIRTISIMVLDTSLEEEGEGREGRGGEGERGAHLPYVSPVWFSAGRL